MTNGDPLTIVDNSTGAGQFVNLLCADDAMFQSEIVLTPRVTVEQGFVTSGDDSTGVHVAVNDGERRIRAVVLRHLTSSALRVAIQTINGYSPGFVFNSLTVDFTLRRATNGDATLERANPVPGGPPLIDAVPAEQLPPSPVATQRLEFGTYDTAASASSLWDTLSLPSNQDFPVGITARQLRIHDADTDDQLYMRANFKLAPGSDGIDPVTASFNDGHTGDFELRDDETPRRWRLTDQGRAHSGVERFDILEDKTIFFVDRRTEIPTRSFASTTVAGSSRRVQRSKRGRSLRAAATRRLWGIAKAGGFRPFRSSPAWLTPRSPILLFPPATPLITRSRPATGRRLPGSPTPATRGVYTSSLATSSSALRPSPTSSGVCAAAKGWILSDSVVSPLWWKSEEARSFRY